MIGTVISHYRIAEKLGEGGMGVVYKAEDTKLHRPVALKVLPRQALITEEDKARFAREAQAAANLNHPNIATIYEFDEVDGQAFIAMEYIDGTTLKQKIAERPLPIEEAIEVAIATAEGLSKAHERGIIHRDIKSDNVMTSKDGQVKIMDFGLAAVGGRSRVTKEGMTMGTVAYMSPEQALGEKLDQRTDIWSLGVVLYEMITGRLPFAGDYEQAIVYRILNEEPEPITSLRSNVPMELERIVRKALQKDRSTRYQTAADLLADLRKLTKEMESGTRVPVPAKKVRLQKRHVYLFGGILGLGAIVVFAVLFILPRPAEAIDSIAVLPLENLSRDPEQEYFVDGMHEALIAELSKISALKVISRTSAMQYKGVKRPMPQIARELGVNGLIEGSVQREGDQVRIMVQLIHGPSDKHLWADSYQREMRGILALQSEVARAIAGKIRIAVTPGEQARLTNIRPVNPRAYELYTLGRHYWSQRTIPAYKKAIESFLMATQQDSTYALAYAGLADTYMLLGEQGGLSQKEARSMAAAAIDKALELDENLGQTHISRGQWNFYYQWNWEEALKAFQRAIELNPGYAWAHQSYGRSLAYLGRFEDALKELQRARELDPLSPLVNAYIGQAYLFARKYDQAAGHLLQSLELNPNHVLLRHNLGEVYLARGRFAEAVVQLEKSVEGSDEPSSHYLAMLGCAYARAARRPDAIKVLNELIQRSKQGLVSAFDMSSLHVALGDNKEALAWLERGYDERDVWLSEFKVWPWFDPLDSDPRFQNLLRRMNLPRNWSG